LVKALLLALVLVWVAAVVSVLDLAALEWGLVVGLVTGLLLGLLSVFLLVREEPDPRLEKPQGLESELVLLKAQKMVWESESVKAQMREKDLRMLLIRESGKVKELRSQLESVLDSVLEKVKE
jgi:hypothetical protein